MSWFIDRQEIRSTAVLNTKRTRGDNGWKAKDTHTQNGTRKKRGKTNNTQPCPQSMGTAEAYQREVLRVMKRGKERVREKEDEEVVAWRERES